MCLFYKLLSLGKVLLGANKSIHEVLGLCPLVQQLFRVTVMEYKLEVVAIAVGPRSHVIVFQALGNWLAVMMVAAFHDHVLVICDLL